MIQDVVRVTTTVVACCMEREYRHDPNRHPPNPRQRLRSGYRRGIQEIQGFENFFDSSIPQPFQYLSEFYFHLAAFDCVVLLEYPEQGKSLFRDFTIREVIKGNGTKFFFRYQDRMATV